VAQPPGQKEVDPLVDLPGCHLLPGFAMCVCTCRRPTASSTAPQVIRTGTQAHLNTAEQVTGTPTGRALTFPVTEDATESSITLGYRFRNVNEIGTTLSA
jgi:hypothetical protein